MRSLTASLMFVSLVTILGCRMEPDLGELVQDMVVQTRYDEESVSPAFNIFHTYSTFAMRIDTMGLVSTRYSDTLIIDGAGGNFVKSVTRRVRDKILQAGYTQVTPQENPDFSVNVILLDNFSFFQAINYAPFYSWYWGYYGYWLPYVATYTTSYGTLAIEIVDIKNYAANGNKYKIIWKAFIGDIYASVDRDTKTLEAVNQAFAQSPYIQKD